MPKRVAVLGGGVAGMSAAHELIYRGFDVAVYEAGAVIGGKARSLDVQIPGTTGPPLPGEHGFRFFPGFYKHLPDTMKRIEVGLVSAFDHLEATKGTLLARTGGKADIITPTTFPTSLGDLIEAFRALTLFYCDLGVPRSEISHFIGCLLKMLVSCDNRRFGQYELVDWYDFIDAGSMSAAYQRYLAKGLSRSLVALNARELSSRTGGCVLLRFLLDFTGFTPLDRVLDLPTNEAWLSHWHSQLARDRVDFHLNSPVQSLQCAGGRITSVRVQHNGASHDVTADYYVAAVPVEVMKRLLTSDMINADPSLAGIQQLCTAWMTGIIFYLSVDVPVVRGHCNYLDSAWALTSISQPQFWPTVDLSLLDDGKVRGILSVIISNWEQPLFGTGPAAQDCTEAEVKSNVWQQLKDHLNSSGVTRLKDADKLHVFLAPCLLYNPASTPKWENREPLFINKINSWPKRPKAVTGIDNLFLASDYVRTFTDLATMEGANEAARRAVNGILDREGSTVPRCAIWPPDEPALLVGYRFMDEYLFSIGLEPLVPPLPPVPWPCV
jgi:uncharacterized protein with NAD-binding domain and iron-sulfur cluster